jgi:transcriptional regulator with XRE-family HTH domain
MPPDDDPLHAERKAFGANLRAVRDQRGMGQREVAARMAERGYAWHQNTVARVEAGARDVSHFEARALAAILRVTTDRFDWTTPEAAAIALMSAAHGRLREAWHEVAGGAARLLAARDAAEKSVAENKDSKYERVRDSARGLAEELRDATLKGALAEAEEIWQRTKRGEA